MFVEYPRFNLMKKNIVNGLKNFENIYLQLPNPNSFDFHLKKRNFYNSLVFNYE